jgi:hypothetical protein
MVMDLDQQIARLERILAKRIPIPESAILERAKRDPARVTHTEALMTGIAKAVSEHLAENVLPILKELQDMRQRMSEIEDRGLKYCGIYQRVLSYQRGDVVTCDGSLWISTCATTGVKPGDGAVWVMITKSQGKAER